MYWIYSKEKGKPFIPENYVHLNDKNHFSQTPQEILNKMFGVSVYFSSPTKWNYRVQEQIKNQSEYYSAYIYEESTEPATALDWEGVKYTWHHKCYWLNHEEFEVIKRELDRFREAGEIKSLYVGYVNGLDSPTGRAGQFSATTKPGYDLILHIEMLNNKN